MWGGGGEGGRGVYIYIYIPNYEVGGLCSRNGGLSVCLSVSSFSTGRNSYPISFKLVSFDGEFYLVLPFSKNFF